MVAMARRSKPYDRQGEANLPALQACIYGLQACALLHKPLQAGSIPGEAEGWQRNKITRSTGALLGGSALFLLANLKILELLFLPIDFRAELC